MSEGEREKEKDGTHLKSIQDVLEAQTILLLLSSCERSSTSPLSRLIPSVAVPGVELAVRRREGQPSPEEKSKGERAHRELARASSGFITTWTLAATL